MSQVSQKANNHVLIFCTALYRVHTSHCTTQSSTEPQVDESHHNKCSERDDRAGLSNDWIEANFHFVVEHVMFGWGFGHCTGTKVRQSIDVGNGRIDDS